MWARRGLEEEYHELNFLFWPPVYYYHVSNFLSSFLSLCCGVGGFLLYLLYVLHNALHHLLESFQAQVYTEFIFAVVGPNELSSRCGIRGFLSWRLQTCRMFS